MNKNPERVDVSSVSPLLLVVAVVLALIALVLLPKARRFYIVLAFTIGWSMVGQMLDLSVHAVAKATFAICLVSLSLAALLHPGPRLRLAPAVLWWLVLAFLSILFVLYVDNLVFALILRFQWIILCVSAFLTVRLMADRQSADAIARAVGVGLMLGIAVALTSIYRTGAGAFHIGRFSPYGANANQVGVLFAASVPFSLYCALRARRRLTRWVSITMAAIALGMVVMTGSRTSVVVTGICLVPYFFSGMRRSAAIISAVLVGAVAVIPFAYTPEIKPAQEEPEGYGMGRLDSLETGRIEIAARYLDESVSKRPITGLLGEEEKSVLRDEDIGMYSHNAYLEMMYVGGIVYTLPMLFLALATTVAAIRVLLARKRLPIDPLLTTILAFFVFAIYIHAMVGSNAYYPTSAWGFIHVLVSAFVLSVAASLTRDARARQKRSRRWVPVVVPSAALAALVALTACCGGSDGKDKQPKATPVTQQQSGPPGAGDDDDGVAGDGAAGADRPIADYRHVDEVDRSEATPDLLCGVKLDVPNDGPQVRKKAKELRVPMHIVFYDVDHFRDGRFDDLDKRRFERWMDVNVPPDSHQIITIDYEKPYWKDLMNYRDLPPERLKEIVAVYREILDFAKARRPKARWGFFGLPMRQYAMKDAWKQRIHELGDLLLKHEDVVLLAIYDNRIGDRRGLDLTAIRTYVELSLAAAGDKPVYAYARGRYMGRPQKFQWIPDDEFRQNLEAALDARWNDGKKEHRLAGIIFWDGLKDRRPNPATPEQLDELYARQLKIVQDTVRARRGKPVQAVPPR